MADCDETSPLTSSTHDIETRRGDYRSTDPENPQGGNGKKKTCCEERIAEWRQQVEFTLIEKEFLGVAVVSAVLMLIFSIIRICLLAASDKPFASEIVMLVSEAFCLYYIFRGILCRRPYEIIFYIVIIYLDVSYCTVDFVYIESPNTLEKIRLGFDWSSGCILPSFLGYYIITRFYKDDKKVSWNPKSNEFISSFIVLGLQLKVCDVIFVLADRDLAHEETLYVPLISIDAVFAAIFCILGFKIHEQFCRSDCCKCDCMKHICTGAFALSGVISIILFLVVKITKQRDGIRNAVYPDVASVIFGGLAAITQGICACFSFYIARKENKNSSSPGGGEASGQSTPGAARNIRGDNTELQQVREGRSVEGSAV